jgi:outer membrane protein TolC
VFLQSVETRVGPQEERVGVRQAVPWRGTLSGRRHAAEARTEAARARLEAARLAAVFELRRAWMERWYLEREIELVAENLEILRRFEGIARTRYKVDALGHPDVVRAQVEIGRLGDRLRALRDRRVPLAARVNAVAGRPPRAPLAVPADPEMRHVAEPAAALVAELEGKQPVLAALDAQTRRAEAEVGLAKARFGPDLTFGLSYTRIDEARSPGVPGSGDDALLATVGISLPVQRGRLAADLASARERERASRAQREGRAASLVAELEQALFEHDDAHRRIHLYRDELIPRTTDSLRATVRGFATGDSDFLDLLDTERTLLELQRALARARADLAITHARLERLVGRPLALEAPRGAEKIR